MSDLSINGTSTGAGRASHITLSDALEATIPAGRFILAMPMLIYPVLHFVYPAFVSTIVPPWIPFRLFWTYFTAVTIFSAGVAFVINKYARLAATLLAIEILLFVLLIHLPLLFHSPSNTWANKAMFGDYPGRIINAFKDFGLCGATFIFAGSQSEAWRRSGRDHVLAFGRAIVLISVAALGALHFVLPEYAPGLPPMIRNVLFPIPGHLFWVYGTAVTLIVTAGLIAANWRVRTTAAFLGVFILFFDLVTWLPTFIAQPMQLTGNWLKDIGIAAGVLILAGAQRRPVAGD